MRTSHGFRQSFIVTRQLAGRQISTFREPAERSFYKPTARRIFPLALSRWSFARAGRMCSAQTKESPQSLEDHEMKVPSYKFLTDTVEQVMEFCQRVKKSASDKGVSAEAEIQLNNLKILTDVIEQFLVQKGRDASLDGSHDAEIHRKPTHRNRPFSCTPTFIIGSRRSGTTLLAYLLNASKNIFALPENFLAGTIAKDDSLIGIGQTLKLILHEPFPRYLWRLAHMCDELYSELARANNKTR
jgi:hypothetical protein